MRRPSHPTVPLTLFVSLMVVAPRLTVAAPETPVPLGGTASATPTLAAPVPAPFVVPAPSGTLELAAGESKKRVEDDVQRGRPTAWRFVAPAKQLLSIGISSPKGDVRLSVYEVGSKLAIAGTEPESGAIRVTTEFPEATELLLVAHTQSDGTPFRFEVSLGPGSM
jgi:hypothetical protein